MLGASVARMAHGVFRGLDRWVPFMRSLPPPLRGLVTELRQLAASDAPASYLEVVTPRGDLELRGVVTETDLKLLYSLVGFVYMSRGAVRHLVPGVILPKSVPRKGP